MKIQPGELVVEVGAGDGRLTVELLRAGARVIAVENDPRLVRRIAERFRTDPRVTVVGVDIRHFCWPRVPHRVVGNPPFGLTTWLLRELLGAPWRPLTGADLVVQRGLAVKRTRSAGHALNLGWQPWWELSVVVAVPRTAFIPAPAVDAALLAIRRRDPPALPAQEATRFAAYVQREHRRAVGRGRPLAWWLRRYRR